MLEKTNYHQEYVQPEKLVKIQSFPIETQQILEKEGFLIYPFSGQSIKSLREAGEKFLTTWHKNYPDFEALTSRLSQVAINPQNLFLPDSNKKTLLRQEEMVVAFSQEISRKIKGVRAIIGEAPDYIELVFIHLKETGEYLFGKKYNYGYARTKTLINDSEVVNVGRFSHKFGLQIIRLRPNHRFKFVWAVPILVPDPGSY